MTFWIPYDSGPRTALGPANCYTVFMFTAGLIGFFAVDRIHGRVAGKTCRRSIYLFMLCISLITKIEIDGKCCHGHSNHELKVDVDILIQIRKHVDALFLRDRHNMNK
jgi:hypothetical protein